MKLSHQKLAEGVGILGRSILSPAPSYANGALASDEAIAEEERRRGTPLEDVWLQFRTGSTSYFIFRGKEGGSYKRQLPAEVDPTGVVTIHLDPSRKPAHDLLDQLSRLVDTLAMQPSIHDSATRETLELVDPATDQPEVERLKPILVRLRQASREDYNTTKLMTLIAPLQRAIIDGIQGKNLDRAREQMQSLRQASASLRDSLAADCLLAGWLRLYPDICDLVIKRSQVVGLDQPHAQAQWVRYVGSGSGPGATNPVALTHGMIAKAVREDMGELMLELADVYASEGAELVEKGLAADTLDAWGRVLYDATLAFYLSNRIGQGLAEGGGPVGASTLEQVKKSQNQAEEQQVLLGNALLFALKNRDDSGFNHQRATIAAERAKGGQLAANKLISDLIEHQYLYPRYYKKRLSS
jgi:hypothetical protein